MGGLLGSLVKSANNFLRTMVACGIFILVGPALMMLNKHIMDELHFNYPITICSLGLVGSSVTSALAVVFRFAEVRLESLRLVAGLRAWIRVALPIGLTKALTMASGNAAYLHLSFGFIQMLKAFTPLIILVVMCITGVRLPTKAAVWCVTAIVAGTLVEVRGEMQATFIGLFLMFFSEVCEAVSVVLSQKILQSHKFTVLEGMYITAPAGAVCLAVGAAMVEGPDMLRSGHHYIPLDYPLQFVMAAALGVGVNFSSFLVIQVTSSLTMKILNTVRGVGLVCVGVVFYGEEHPWLQLVGYCVALVGFAGYNYFQLFPDAAHAVEHRVETAAQRLQQASCCKRMDARPL